jgi:hypothetical protein
MCATCSTCHFILVFVLFVTAQAVKVLQQYMHATPSPTSHDRHIQLQQYSELRPVTDL